MVRVTLVRSFIGRSAMRAFAFLLAVSALAACATVPPTPPLAITSHEPATADYPIGSVSLREQGATVVQYLVLADGTVGDTIIASRSGSPRLDQAAVQLVTGWRFEPATENGRPIPAWLSATVVFALR